MAKDESLSIIVRDRQRILFKEEVKAVTSLNDTGIFDVLPEHANFISLIREYLTIHRHDGTKQDLKIEGGVLKVFGNEVRIYLGLKTSVKPQLKELEDVSERG